MLSPLSVVRVCSIGSTRLCDVRFTAVKANIDLSSVIINGKNGDFNPTSLAHVINKPTINKLVVQSWLEKARRSAV